MTSDNALAPLCLAVSLLATGCADDTASAFAGELEYSAEHALFEGFDYDSGFVPEQSPVSLRARASASGTVTVSSRATTDGEALVPVEGSGALSTAGMLEFELSARVDLPAGDFEGVVDTFSYAIDEASVGFDPFILEDAVVATAELPAAELASVPLGSIPGATLVVSVAGGELTSRFEGTCAAGVDGYGQVMGRTSVGGTVDLEGTVVIEVPLLDDQVFGPFPIAVPLPETSQTVDLGTRSLSTGELAEDLQPCLDAPEGGSSTDPATSGGKTDDTNEEPTGGPETTDGSDGETGDGETGDGGPEVGEAACSDGIDNDGDGVYDCFDPGCAGADACLCGVATCGECASSSACFACIEAVGMTCSELLDECDQTATCPELIECAKGCGEDEDCLFDCAAEGEPAAMQVGLDLLMCITAECPG